MGNNAELRSLQDLVDEVPNLVEYFYNDTDAPHTKHNAALSPVPAEFTNWRDEQRGWRESAVIFDQSHHMPALFLSGPDAMKLLMDLSINNYKNFAPGRAKQFVVCNPSGYFIGESVLYYHDDESFELTSGMTALNWVQFNAEQGGYDVTITRDNQTSMNTTGRRVKFRFGMDGPNAKRIFNAVVEGEAPDVPFFRTRKVRIAGIDVVALGHGMAGHAGVELSGHYEDGPTVRAAILAAGKDLGLIEGGSRTYFSTLGEAGWMPYPTPAIYTGEEMRAFREWLPANGWEARTQLGGSFHSQRIEDYYVTPWDLGVDRLMKFDRDFVGREALERMAAGTKRKRVTLVWDDEDVRRITGSLLEPGTAFKYMDMPVASYSFQQNDQVLDAAGELVGLANFCGYTVNEKKFLGLAMVREDLAEPGTELRLIWGEPDGGSRKPFVEHHRQTEVRVTVAPSPYAQAVREMKGLAST